MCRRLVSMMATLCRSFMQRCNIVYPVLSTRMLLGSDPALLGGTVSHLSVSDAGMIQQSQGSKHPVLLVDHRTLFVHEVSMLVEDIAAFVRFWTLNGCLMFLNSVVASVG